MNFTDIVTQMMLVLKRPDKLADMRREVNAAIMFFSSNQNFSRDVVELSLPIDPAEYTQVLLFSGMERYRRVKYIKRGGTKEYLKKLSAQELGTDCDMKDKYYVVGTGIKIAMTKVAAALDVAYYQYPPTLTDAAPDYWMLDAGWTMVFNRACAKVFAAIGDDASAKMHEGYARVDYQAFCDFVDKDLGYE